LDGRRFAIVISFRIYKAQINVSEIRNKVDSKTTESAEKSTQRGLLTFDLPYNLFRGNLWQLKYSEASPQTGELCFRIPSFNTK